DGHQGRGVRIGCERHVGAAVSALLAGPRHRARHRRHRCRGPGEHDRVGGAVRGDRATHRERRNRDEMNRTAGFIAAAFVAACAHSPFGHPERSAPPLRSASDAREGSAVQRSERSAVRRTAADTIIATMIQEGTQHSHVDADLEYLLDVIGPRLTGSPEMKRANEWTLEKFREYGVDRADLESWKFGVAWTRGPMSIHMTAPQQRELLGVSWAWAPGTNGPL